MYIYKYVYIYIYIYIYIYVYCLHTYTCVCVHNASAPFDPLVHLLETPFQQNSPGSQSQEKNLNILKTKRAFEVK